MSLSHTYADMPLPSTVICPSVPLAVAALGLAAGAFDADADTDADTDADGVVGTGWWWNSRLGNGEGAATMVDILLHDGVGNLFPSCRRDSWHK